MRTYQLGQSFHRRITLARGWVAFIKTNGTAGGPFCWHPRAGTSSSVFGRVKIRLRQTRRKEQEKQWRRCLLRDLSLAKIAETRVVKKPKPTARRSRLAPLRPQRRVKSATIYSFGWSFTDCKTGMSIPSSRRPTDFHKR